MIFWGCLVFSRDFRRPKTAKFKIYFNFEDCRGFRCGSLFGAVVVSTGGRLAGCFLMLCLRGVFPAFCPLSCFALGALLADMPLFRVLRGFLAWFGVFVWVCIGCVLCVVCVAFVRVYS